MARLISQKGLTANTTIGSPQEGFKWIVRWALVVLHTSSTTGTRYVTLGVVRGGNTSDAGADLATTEAQTGTSTTYVGTGEVVNPQLYTSYSTIFYTYPEIFSTDIVYLFGAFISGDTADYYMMVEEVPS
jgi:hypothetical protein